MIPTTLSLSGVFLLFASTGDLLSSLSFVQ